MSQPIVFYDILNSRPAGSDERSWTPNLLKTRLTLNYKRITYKTVWVEFADVQAINKKIGATPTTKYPDGTARYTLPTIHDPNTGRIVSESYAIARYLDEYYPDRPVLTKASEELQEHFATSADSVVGTEGLVLCLQSSWEDLGDTRNRKTLENLFPFAFPSGFAVDRTKPLSEDVFVGFLRLVDARAAAKDTAGIDLDIAFIDLITMAYLRWLQLSLRNEERFGELLHMDGGKAQAVYNSMKAYLSVDQGETVMLST